MNGKEKIKSLTPGLIISILVAALSILVAPMIPGVNAILIALLVGMVLGNVTDWTKKFEEGIDFSGSRVLELSIVLLAFEMSMDDIGELGWQTIVIILVMVILLIFITVDFSKRFNCPKSAGLLTGFGTTICGSSAIAAVAPTVAKDKNDIGISLAVVSLIGAIFMFVWPLVNTLFDMDEQHIAILTGGTLHSVGNVAGAGYSINEDVGKMAVTIKMFRVAMLAPAVLLFNVLTRENKPKSFLEAFKLPLYLWAFIAVTLVVAFVNLPEVFITAVSTAAKWLLTIAMAAIGFKTSFKTLYKSGKKVMMFGFVIYFIQVIIVALGVLLLL